MIQLVTFSDSRMTKSKVLCCQSALEHGVDNCWAQNPDTISIEFKELNRDIFKDGVRGAGCYWLFKPYHIYKAMLRMNEGDILIYSDAGIEFIDSVHEITSRMDQDIFFFTNGFPHVEWCKMDVCGTINSEYFLGVEEEGGDAFRDWPIQYTPLKQVQASVIFFKVNQKTKDFAKEWLLYSQIPGFIDDSPSKLPNYSTFAEHRHDQAILTCLQIKYGYKLHFWPTLYSEHIRHTAQPGDSYPTLFNHHRKRDPGKGGGQPEWP